MGVTGVMGVYRPWEVGLGFTIDKFLYAHNPIHVVDILCLSTLHVYRENAQSDKVILGISLPHQLGTTGD